MGRAEILMPWVEDALRELGGRGSVVDVCKTVWRKHGEELERHGDLFYTWQYDIRWAAQKLRDSGVLAPMAGRRSADWQLVATVTELDGADMWATSEADEYR